MLCGRGRGSVPVASPPLGPRSSGPEEAIPCDRLASSNVAVRMGPGQVWCARDSREAGSAQALGQVARVRKRLGVHRAEIGPVPLVTMSP